MRKLIYLSIITVFCIVLLYVFVLSKSSSASNGFSRRPVDSKVELKNFYKFPNRSFDFLWEPSREIDLVNYENLLKPYTIDYSLKKLEQMNIPTAKGFNTNSPRMSFNRKDPSMVFATDKKGNVSVHTNSRDTTYKLSPSIFDTVIGLSENSIITCGWDVKRDGHLETVLNKVILAGKSTISKRFPLPKQVDGFFCTDGMLHYDYKNSRIFYMFFHRGEFLCLDTNLNLLYKAKTIDTVNFAKIRFTPYEKGVRNGKEVKSRRLSAPLEFVQLSISTDDEYVYIHSNVKADNDSLKMEPIDIYSKKNGKYLHSLYLPKYLGNRLRNFKIKDNLIAALYDRYLITFKFTQ